MGSVTNKHIIQIQTDSCGAKAELPPGQYRRHEQSHHRCCFTLMHAVLPAVKRLDDQDVACCCCFLNCTLQAVLPCASGVDGHAEGTSVSSPHPPPLPPPPLPAAGPHQTWPVSPPAQPGACQPPLAAAPHPASVQPHTCRTHSGPALPYLQQYILQGKHDDDRGSEEMSTLC